MYSSVVANYKWKECDRHPTAFSENFSQPSLWGWVWDASTCVCVRVCLCRWLVISLRLHTLCQQSEGESSASANVRCGFQSASAPFFTHRSHSTRPVQQNWKHRACLSSRCSCCSDTSDRQRVSQARLLVFIIILFLFVTSVSTCTTRVA